MAFALEVWTEDLGDGAVKVVHTFYGYSEREVRTYCQEHQEMDKYFDDSIKQGRASEELEEIDDDEMPGADEDEDEDEDE